jgi:hypothetical protein
VFEGSNPSLSTITKSPIVLLTFLYTISTPVFMPFLAFYIFQKTQLFFLFFVIFTKNMAFFSIYRTRKHLIVFGEQLEVR